MLWSATVQRALALVVCAVAAHCVLTSAQFTIGTQRVNHQINPVIDTPNPIFSWELTHENRSQYQTAYWIQVSTDPNLTPGFDVWFSGRVESAQTMNVPYPMAGAGVKALQSDTTYWWGVISADANGILSDRSVPQSFDVAWLRPAEEWADALWLGSTDSAASAKRFRAQFTTNQSPAQIARARAYVVGLGWHTFSLNGPIDPKPPGLVIPELVPGWTQYSRRILYMSYDITSVLTSGVGTTKAVGIECGIGYRDTSKYPNLNGDSPKNDTHPLVVRMIITIDYQNGQSQRVVTDSTSWMTASGPTTASSVYDGTSYDARLEQPGWDTPNFSPGPEWSSAVEVESPGGILAVQSIPPVTLQTTIPALAAPTQPWPNTFVYDFGQNFAGVCALTLPKDCPVGTVIILQHAEILQDDGSGLIYTDNLRSAKATDTFTCGSNSNAGTVWIPRYTYHGFRFVQVTGLPDNSWAVQSLLVGRHFHTNNAIASTVTFSDSILNGIQSAVVWGQRSNMMSVPTDCDQRDERLGWMGDASLSSDTFMYNFDSAAFFTHYLNLIRDEQGADNTIPDVVPFMRYGGRPADPSWSAAYPQLVYSMYKYYADKTIITSHLPNLLRYLSYVTERVDQSGFAFFYQSYGDWVPPPPAPKCSNSYLSGTSYLRNIQQIQVLARVVGNQQIVDQMQHLFNTQSAAFNAAWANSVNATYDNAVQTALTFPLQLNLVSEGNPMFEQLTANLINDIVTNQQTHITTGISGFKSLWATLGNDRLARTDLVYAMAMTTDYPSLGWMLFNPLEPATTVWELMDAPSEGPGMNSRSHHMWSSIGQALLESLAGLKAVDIDSVSDPEKVAGWRAVECIPAEVPGLSQVSVSLKHERGSFSMDWQRVWGIQCGKVSENMDLTIECNSGTISIDFASYGQPLGQCGEFGIQPACHASNSTNVVAALCAGQSSCVIPANNTVFGEDPCNGERKWLVVQAQCSMPSMFIANIALPPGTTGVLKAPYLSMNGIEVRESSTAVYANQQFIPGAEGVVSAYSNSFGTVDIAVQSGVYYFEMLSQLPTTHVCGVASELQTLTLTCPSNSVIARVVFASFGTSPVTSCPSPTAPAHVNGEAPPQVYTISTCHAGTSRMVFENACLGQGTCSVFIENQTFGGDPCVDVPKHAIVDVSCALN